MMQISKILKHERLTLALTGLKPEEFNHLLPTFSESWDELKLQDWRKHKKERTRKPGGGRKGYLKEMQDKLFFILFYYKCYPTYDLASFLYGFDRGNAQRRQEQLAEVLEKALGKKMALPARRLRKIEDFFAMFPEAREVFVDGTERPVQRPKDKEAQKDKYSGKKKRHTVKNIIISTKEKRIGFLSKTVNGKEHDFTILKAHAPPKNIPQDIKQHLDMGFIGYHDQFPDHKISMP
ncbi:MAG: transposase, partial [Candidatus Portnoybacteria bacterium]|nr:transposase [Candidatus Portnoybacteria bacterium]